VAEDGRPDRRPHHPVDVRHVVPGARLHPPVVGQRQRLAGLRGQLRGVRLGQAEQRTRLGRRVAFHADVPENRPPALRQGHERRHDKIRPRPARLGGAGLTIPGRGAGRLTRHGGGGLADGRQQVRAERVGGPAAPLHRGKDVLEGLVNGVFRGGAAGQQELSEAARGRHVPPAQQPVGDRIARANGVENIRVAAASGRASG
jgi:hypothetical protein